jgi:hypothetical protein
VYSVATDEENALRLRYRRQLRRLDELLAEHSDVALKTTGGNIKAAAHIMRGSLATDETFQWEMEVLRQLGAQIGFPAYPDLRPSEHPKTRTTSKRGRR